MQAWQPPARISAAADIFLTILFSRLALDEWKLIRLPTVDDWNPELLFRGRDRILSPPNPNLAHRQAGLLRPQPQKERFCR